MNPTFMAPTTLASTSYFLRQIVDIAIESQNETKTQIPSSSIFHRETDTYLTPDEEYFHRILMKYQQSFEHVNQRQISITWSAIVGTFFICLTIFGLVGNTAVILAVACDRVMRKSAMNILLLNLAVADALNLILIILEWSPAVIYGYPAWGFPALLCPLARYLECTFLFASILTQLVVCIERYIAIVYPIHTRRICTRQNILLAALCTWVVASFFSLPYLLVHVKPIGHMKCVNPYNQATIWIFYKFFEFLAAYALPCAIMIFLYGKVACVLWSKHSNLMGSSHVNEKTRLDMLEVRRGVIKMLLVCVLIYFVSYSPIQGIFIMTAMFGPNSRPPYSVVLLLNGFAIISSSSNPLIYSLFSKKFRSRIIYLLSCGRHGRTFSKYDMAYSFKPKKNNNSSLEPENSGLLQSTLTPDDHSQRRYITLTSNSPM